MTLLQTEHCAAFKRFIEVHQQFIIAGHKEPDADCLTSCLGAAAIVAAFHKPCFFFSAGPFKRQEIKRFEYLFPKTFPAPKPAELAQTGLILVDCSELERLGDTGYDVSQLDLFIIDHHRTSVDAEPPRFTASDCRVIDPGSPSTTLLIQQLYEGLLGRPGEDIASLLFLGLATDTNFFRFLGPGDSEVFRTAARLAEYGASPRQIYDDMSGGQLFSTRKLLGIMLGRTEQKFNGQVVYTYETLADTQQWGKEGRDSDSLYQLLLSVEGVKAVVFVRQETEHKCTIGLRSRDALDVSAIAAKFGGGGHRNAAGATTPGLIRDVLSVILDELEQAL
ncbi:MAG: bifunctional oligoribonuclease/PAP phosphatase NrnA [Treponema sp.]|jgi:phosphoesterase RecJ-like protein|nr:bifunctional oligoribonuclease/PAP phosphatase NrnA [Treponema sp.]